MTAITQEPNHSKVLPSVMLRKHRDAILASAKANGLSNVRVFGSVLHQTDTLKSDLDLLITSSENTSLFQLGDFQDAVEQLVGASVDVVDDQWISKYYGAQVIAEARAI
jgi:uncharacterized protein